MRITVDDLKEKGACEDGIEDFMRVFPDGIDVPEWTPWCQTIALGTTGKWIGWAWAVGLIPQLSLSEANLWGANLYEANLIRSNLSGCNLIRANLRGANLYEANLRGANLREADLRGSNLCGTLLYGADLRGARRYESDAAIPGWRVVGSRLEQERQS